MSRSVTSRRPIVAWALVGAISAITPIPSADARPPKKAISLEDLTTSLSDTLPIGVLRRVAQDYASRGIPLSCPDLRRCGDLNLNGVQVDLDGDGSKEWFVTDMGFTGSGAELDYIFKTGADRRWQMVGRIEALHLLTVGPEKTNGFLDIHGYLVGHCVGGRGKAIWNGHRYVERRGRGKDRPC